MCRNSLKPPWTFSSHRHPQYPHKSRFGTPTQNQWLQQANDRIGECWRPGSQIPWQNFKGRVQIRNQPSFLFCKDLFNASTWSNIPYCACAMRMVMPTLGDISCGTLSRPVGWTYMRMGPAPTQPAVELHPSKKKHMPHAMTHQVLQQTSNHPCNESATPKSHPKKWFKHIQTILTRCNCPKHYPTQMVLGPGCNFKFVSNLWISSIPATSCCLPHHFSPRHHGAIGGVHVARDAVQGARHTRAIVGGPAATQQLVLVEGI